MKIICPHCNFSRDVPDNKLPDRPARVTCPRCQQGFVFRKDGREALPPGSPEQPDTATETVSAAATIVCPACGLEQAGDDLCAGCGVVFAKWAARHETPQAEFAASSANSSAIFPGRESYSAVTLPADQPKAGFWIRFVAYTLDAAILGAAQFAISLALGFVGGALLGNSDAEIALAVISGLCGMVVSLTYAVFFTGYNGQTPGKMAVRIQVIRTDGSPMTYGRAFLREVIGKFASSIIFGIGYLMVAFDRQKQGLHDKIAGTYVVRL